ncbi:hypothetical protein SAMN05216337_103486 [Bradyrhizobium brasilense]|uniref:Uncharacterized protein n=1 Tax=Bradyrhizobium brasilense TaxID=1419277 RepID=A0A1G7FNJ7_9BRAD|nr:hypothetical protein SAMN05216337_103486 [Bradyrhizobium brasilense]
MRRNLHQATADRPPKERQPKRRKRPTRDRYSLRAGCSPIALRAFRSMHVEAMNWSGIKHAEYGAALGLSPDSMRIWRDRLEDSGDEIDWRWLLHPSARAQSSSAANCARRRYRLTPEAVDRRSNRRRFGNRQKQVIVQQTEKPGVSVAQVCAWVCTRRQHSGCGDAATRRRLRRRFYSSADRCRASKRRAAAQQPKCAHLDGAKHAVVLAPFQGKAAARRWCGRPGPPPRSPAP